MREIKYRAKDIKTGKWVYGLPQQRSEVRGFANRDKEAEIGHIVSFEPHRMLESGANDYCLFWYEIDPETLGEYIGLKDKHGKEIFEGDIVRRVGGNELAMIQFTDGIAKGCDPFVESWSGWQSADGEDVEIIGNIYENHGLLEKQP